MPKLLLVFLLMTTSTAGFSQTSDWENLKKYAAANMLLGKQKNNNKRVVFIGNSITEGWIQADSAFFTKSQYINRGIGGQTTPQMLLRFREDVILLKPKVVVILAGINDIAGNTGQVTTEYIFGNIVSMTQLAKANGIRPIICSVLPAFEFPWRKGLQPAPKVLQLNAMLKTYALQNGIAYVDYHSAMKDDRDGLPPNLATDGVHPTMEGYKVMEPLVEKVIRKALIR